MLRNKAALLYSFVIVSTFTWGIAVGRYELFPFTLIKRATKSVRTSESEPKSWRWNEAVGSRTSREDSLAAIGYSGAYEPVNTHSTSAISSGGESETFTIVCSGDGLDVLLIDSKGAIRHSWTVPFEEQWLSETPSSAAGPLQLQAAKENQHRSFVRCASLLNNGGLITLLDYTGIALLDSQSKVIWRSMDCNHHYIEVDEPDKVVTLGRLFHDTLSVSHWAPSIAQRLNNQGDDGFYSDTINIYDAEDGTLIEQFDVTQELLRSRYSTIATHHILSDPFDALHANSVDRVTGDVAATCSTVSAGDFIVSFREPSLIACFDADSGNCKWAELGPWRYQHSAKMLSDDVLLMFDNQGATDDHPIRRDQSRVLQWDLPSKATTWIAEELPGGENFYSKIMGSVEPTASETFLATVSCEGRVYEFTQNGDLVWAFENPRRGGPDGTWVATTMEARRIPLGLALEIIEE